MFRAIRRMFDYAGRSTRWEYWSFFIGFGILIVLLAAWAHDYEGSHFGMPPHIADSDVGATALLFLGLVAAPNLALKVRRYHDFGWSGVGRVVVLRPTGERLLRAHAAISRTNR